MIGVRLNEQGTFTVQARGRNFGAFTDINQAGRVRDIAVKMIPGIKQEYNFPELREYDRKELQFVKAVISGGTPSESKHIITGDSPYKVDPKDFENTPLGDGLCNIIRLDSDKATAFSPYIFCTLQGLYRIQFKHGDDEPTILGDYDSVYKAERAMNIHINARGYDREKVRPLY